MSSHLVIAPALKWSSRALRPELCTSRTDRFQPLAAGCPYRSHRFTRSTNLWSRCWKLIALRDECRRELDSTDISLLQNVGGVEFTTVSGMVQSELEDRCGLGVQLAVVRVGAPEDQLHTLVVTGGGCGRRIVDVWAQRAGLPDDLVDVA